MARPPSSPGARRADPPPSGRSGPGCRHLLLLVAWPGLMLAPPPSSKVGGLLGAAALDRRSRSARSAATRTVLVPKRPEG